MAEHHSSTRMTSTFISILALAVLMFCCVQQGHAAFWTTSSSTSRVSRPFGGLTTKSLTWSGTTWIDYTASTQLFASTAPKKKAAPKKKKNGGYEPKWKKKATLAEDGNGNILDFTDKGLKGGIKVVFRQGNETKSTMALPGQPLRSVASQAGQFIKYGCGKGECGTCEALVNGQWIRPCSTYLPASLAPGDEYVVQVKEGKAKAISSGKFYSFRSFLRGFWNNAIGMVGFVKSRRNANRNWKERQEYEDLIKARTLEKKRQRMAAAAEGGNNKNGPSA